MDDHLYFGLEDMPQALAWRSEPKRFEIARPSRKPDSCKPRATDRGVFFRAALPFPSSAALRFFAASTM
jgi:hypothetical protein